MTPHIIRVDPDLSAGGYEGRVSWTPGTLGDGIKIDSGLIPGSLCSLT